MATTANNDTYIIAWLSHASPDCCRSATGCWEMWNLCDWSIVYLLARTAL